MQKTNTHMDDRSDQDQFLKFVEACSEIEKLQIEIDHLEILLEVKSSTLELQKQLRDLLHNQLKSTEGGEA